MFLVRRLRLVGLRQLPRRTYSSAMWEILKPQLQGLDLPPRWHAFVARVQAAADPEAIYNLRDGQSLKAFGHYDVPAKPVHEASTFAFTRELQVIRGALDSSKSESAILNCQPRR